MFETWNADGCRERELYFNKTRITLCDGFIQISKNIIRNRRKYLCKNGIWTI